MIENNKQISVSLIDVKGSVNNGVVVLLNLMIVDEPFEIGLWFNKDNDVIISPEDKLLEYLEVGDIKDYEYYTDLLYFIYDSIPSKDDLLKEFVK